VNPGIEDSYSASNASTQVFDMAFLKVDSDQAFATAQKHGGDKILEKAPDTPLTYICDWNHNTNELTWHVIYGPRGTSSGWKNKVERVVAPMRHRREACLTGWRFPRG